jgi:thiol reductant ABC exporter CydC subunit
MSRSDARSLLAAGRPARGEGSRLAFSVALAAGAAAAAIGLLSTSGYLISRAAQRPEILTLMVAIVAVRAFGIIRAVLRYVERLVSHDLALRHLSRLRARFYRRLVPLVPGALQERSGDLLSRFVADVDTLQDLHLRVVIPAALSLLVLGGATLAAWLMLPAAGVAVFACLASSIVLLPMLSSAVAARAARRQAPARAALTSALVESIDGAGELALAGRAQERVALLEKSDARLAGIARRDALACSLAAGAGGALSGASIVLLLLVAIPAVRAGALAGVLLAALLFLLLGAYESVLPLSTAARRLHACAAAAGRLAGLGAGAEAPVICDPPAPLRAPGGGDLRLRGVGFRYEEDGPWVLRGLDMAIAPGEHVGLSGASGAGKSTVAELLVRFADPVSGSVTLDGIDLRELSQQDIRGAVTLCGQDCHVFNTSIRENLLIGRREAGEGEIARAVQAVGLDGWIAELPDGLETILGQGGELASGGQRRRIALARALLSGARFLILDEPTAHLDPELAAGVMAGVLEMCTGRGLLVISHDVGMLGGMDRVHAPGRGDAAGGRADRARRGSAGDRLRALGLARCRSGSGRSR